MNFEKIPKIELHHHLELSFTWPELYAMAQEDGTELDLEAFEKHFALTEPSKNLGEVLHKFLGPAKLLNTQERLSQIVSNTCKRAKSQGIKILELRYAPSFLGDLNSMDYETIHQGIKDGIPHNDPEIEVGLIGIFQRTKSQETNQKVLDFFKTNRSDFVGIDLADDEDKFESNLFAPLFKEISGVGLPITIHAGEVPSDISIKNVKDSIFELGARRIGHGIQSIRDNELIEILKRENILLEVCPTSNWITQSVVELKDHPIKRLLDAGVKVSINTDDPGVFSLDLINEYKVCHELLGLSADELDQTNRWAYEASFIPDEKKSKFENLFTL